MVTEVASVRTIDDVAGSIGEIISPALESKIQTYDGTPKGLQDSIAANLDEGMFILLDPAGSLPVDSPGVPTTVSIPPGWGWFRFIGPVGSFTIDMVISRTNGEGVNQAFGSSFLGAVASYLVTEGSAVLLTGAIGIAAPGVVLGVAGALGVAFAASVVGGIVGATVNNAIDGQFQVKPTGTKLGLGGDKPVLESNDEASLATAVDSLDSKEKRGF